MANYTKATDFAAKDALASGNANKIIRGSELDDEFSNIQTAVNSKSNTNSPEFTGIPLAPTAAANDNSTKIATTAFVQSNTTAAVQAAYPVGSIYMNASSSTNPATLLGFGTWTALAAGRMLMGSGGGYTGTGGSADAIVVAHTHSATSGFESTAHSHAFSGTTSTTGAHTHTYGTSGVAGDGDWYAYGAQNSGSFTTSSAGSHSHTFSGSTGTESANHYHAISVASSGSSGTNANLPPYLVVYMWQRTA